MMQYNHLSNEELIHHVDVTVEDRTELEVALAERIARLLDEVESFGVHD